MFKHFIIFAVFVIFAEILLPHPADADDFHSPEELEQFYLGSLTNACRTGCEFTHQGSRFKIVRMEAIPFTDNKRAAYLVTSLVDRPGSAGYPSAIYIRENGAFNLIYSRFGVTAEQAERVVQQYMYKEDLRQTVDDSLQKDTSWFKILAVFTIILTVFYFTFRLTKDTVSRMSFLGKFALLVLTSACTSVLLYSFGISSSLILPIAPMFAGLSIALVFSLNG